MDIQLRAMVRRTPKPFTVEIRKAGRQVKAAAASWPDDPMMTDDQPHVSWPGLDDAPETIREAQEPPVAPKPAAGRVLPALDERKPPMGKVDPKRTDRARVRSKPPIVEDLPAEMVAPALADISLSLIEPEPGTLAADEEPADAIEGVSGAKAIASTPILRHGHKRLLRSDFRRGERWKARLPIAALRQDRRKRATP